MFSIYRELHPPTVVDHAVKCHFFDDQEINLVTAGSSRIHVYRLYEADEEGANKSDVPGFAGHEIRKKHKLEEVASYSFFGNILNMQVVRLAGNSRDSILLAFKDAKLSIVEYDPSNHDLKTDSMHFFEEQELRKGVSHNIHNPLVRVDPENRCACMLIYGSFLVILPFKSKVSSDSQMSDDEGGHIKSVLPSYMIDLTSFDQPLSNIMDLQFLHGYQEPTILLLYEPVQTSAGRIAVRQDTYCVSALSLNMNERVHPIIWSVNNLPFDCQMIRAIEKPLGGVLVFACNSLIYLNQSIPPYGVSLNSMTDASTMFPLKNQGNVVISLTEATCDFISNDKLVLSLKGGEIYVLTLLTDGLRSIRSFHFDKAAGSVLASCLCALTDAFVFIGSRLGNSLLLRYLEKTGEISYAPKSNPGEPPLSKKRRIDDADELELFGDSTEPSASVVTTYTFDVSDSLLNIGPITKSAIGEPAFLSEEFFGGNKNDLELVCCSGYGKNGALSILQRTIRPQVVTTFELPGCVDMWTVYSKQKEESKELYHSYLILSREDSTLVLKTGDEISEVDNSGFNLQSPTVYAGNLGLNKYIVQVCPQSIRLLAGVDEVQDIPLDSGSSNIIFGSMADPHGVLITEDGFIIYMQLVEDFNGPKLKLIRPNIERANKIVTACVYKDQSGLFNVENTFEDRQNMRLRRQSTVVPTMHTLVDNKLSLSVDDEEELLYGDSSLVQDAALQEAQLSNIRRPSFAFQTTMRSKHISYWCIMSRDHGGLEIYSLPDFQLVFSAMNFDNAPKVLIDTGNIPSQKMSPIGDNREKVKELVMIGSGHKRKRSYLFAMIDQDLVVYECFHYNKNTLNNHLSIRFKRLESNMLMRIKEESKLAEMADPTSMKKMKVPQLRVVENVSNYEPGVFVCGAYPHWVFISTRGVINGHPMTVDGSIISFASFNNVNCSKGFLYFNKMGELRIAVLPSHLNYDSPWPVRKVPLRMTPYDIVYDHESKVYAVAVAYTENHKKLPRFHTEEREFDTVEREERYIYPQIDRFLIQLISPISWEVVPNTRTVLHEFEHVTCMKMVSLKSDIVESGFKSFLAVGTTYNFGEDLACKGRVLIFAIIEVVPEPGKPLTKTRYKCLYDKEQKGPVTSICCSSGYLIVAVGQKIYAYSFKDDDLVGVAFVDSQVYTVSLIAIRNIIIAADISRSISLIRFQVNHKSLALVSRDSKPLEAYCAEFYIDGPQIGFLVSDANQNIVIFTYQPEALESFGGHHLLAKADFNTGSHCNAMFRVKASQEEPSLNKTQEQRQITYMCTLDGSIASVLPLAEKTYRRLLMLQNKLSDCLQHKAGLNPRSYRGFHVPIRNLANPHKNILDGELLMKYAHLSFQERTDIAKKMGTTSYQILDDMMDIRRASAHF